MRLKRRKERENKTTFSVQYAEIEIKYGKCAQKGYKKTDIIYKI